MCCQRPLTFPLSSTFSSPVFSTPLSLCVSFPTLLSFHQVLPSTRLLHQRERIRGRGGVTGEQHQHRQASLSLRGTQGGGGEEGRSYRSSEEELGDRSGAFFSFLFFLGCKTLPGSYLLSLFSSSSSSSAPLLLPTLLPAPPWGLSFPSPSPPPCLPIFPGRCWEPPGCCTAGGCLAGSLRRCPRRLHSCWGGRGGSARTVRSERSRCLMLRGRSSRTHGDTSTRTVRMWGSLCSYGEFYIFTGQGWS